MRLKYLKLFNCRQHLTRHQLYGHLPPITKTIQARRTRHARHCWRSKDELISDVPQWTPEYGQAKAGRPARTYIQQICEDTGCSLEDQPEAINDRKKWRERVRDIRASGTIWWWWWTVCKKKKRAKAHLQMSSTKCVYESYMFNIYKEDLFLNNLQYLICHKTKPNQINILNVNILCTVD